MQDSGLDSDDNEIESYTQKDFMFDEDAASSHMTPGPSARPGNPILYQMLNNANGGDETRRYHQMDRDSLSSIGDFSEGIMSEDEDGHRNLKSAFLSMSVEDSEEKRSNRRKRAHSLSRRAVMLYEHEQDKKTRWDKESQPGIRHGLGPGPPLISTLSTFHMLAGGSTGGESRESSRRSSGSSIISMEQEERMRN